MSTTQNIINNLTSMSNAEIFNAVRNFDKNFAKITSEQTNEGFSIESMQASSTSPSTIINDFVGLSLKLVLNLVTQSYIKSVLDDSGILQSYSEKYGGYISRISIDSLVNPINPKFLELTDGESIDPFTVRKIRLARERFFKLNNFNYQNLITVQKMQINTVLNSEYGYGALLSSYANAIEQSYRLQKEVTLYECIHRALSSTEWPMKPTQKITIEVSDKNNLSNEDIANIVRSVYDIKTATEISSYIDNFNSFGYKSGVNFGDFVLLVRPQILTSLKFNINVFGLLNGKNLDFPEGLKVVQVKDFGGLEAYKDPDYTTKLNVKYGEKFGEVIGYVDPAAAETIIPESDVYWKDPHADIVAVLAQRGVIFEVQGGDTGYQVNSVWNPAGLYTNIWASRPMASYLYDPAFNLISISVKNKAAEQA